jgi:GTPase Era involved in 16S rRNA processing
MSLPVFAVVGRPNKGKSSIVATLARDDSVYIDARAGSTRKARTFPMVADGETLYALVDTPGIQRARAVLDWLEAHCAYAAARPQTVRDFVAEHRNDPRFSDECELLAPIVEGAGIIYVVDGSCPFGADYEAEMEILRWTGRPSLALINPIDNADYASEWSAGLGQFFRTVREFDAHRAEHAKQLELLELFGHLDPEWQDSLRRAVTILEAERESQHQAASLLITDLILESLTFKTSQRLLEGMPTEPVQRALALSYRRQLAERERRCRRQVEEVYHYRNLQRSEEGLALEDSDLFNVENWYLWGLSKRSLTLVASSAGALIGGGAGMVVDGVTGGLLGGLATVASGAVGAVSGGMGAWRYADEIARIQVKGIPTGGKLLTYGPSRNINFPFVLLGRALLHHQLLCHRTHADRSALSLDDALLEKLDERERRTLARLFADVRADKRVAERRRELGDMLLDWCRRHDTH